MSEGQDEILPPEGEEGPRRARRAGGMPEGEPAPPQIPDKGLAVPPPTLRYASDLRKRIKEDPYSVPYPLHCWLAEYDAAHPYGYESRTRKEAHFVEMNEVAWRAQQERDAKEQAEVEYAKGEKTNKLLGEFVKLTDSLQKGEAAKLETYFKFLNMAFEKGAKAATDARATTTEEVKTALESLSNVVERLGSLNEKMHQEREELFDERAELFEQLNRAMDGQPINPTLFERLAPVAKKALTAFSPMLKKMNIDVAALLEPAKGDDGE